MRRLALASLLSILLLGVTRAEEATEVEVVAPKLRLVHLVDGLRSQPKNRNLTITKKTEIYKVAKAAGVDLESPMHPLVVASYQNKRLFYVFFKIGVDAFGDRPYLIQRIKKTERTWATPDQEEPDVRTTYQVEVFKTFAGAIKRGDQHHGSYGLRENHRREVVKEYEFGFGEVPGECEGTDWPYEKGRLFEYVQRYQEEPGVYPEVKFLASTPWSLHVAFHADGEWSVRCPELGIDAPESLPDPEAAVPPADPASKSVVLEAGQGPEGLLFGESRLEDLVERYGEPRQAQLFDSGSGNYWFGKGLTFNLDKEGLLNTVLTLPGFSGRTKSGLRHGDPRHRVLEVLGMPRPTRTNAPSWSYDGLYIWFDGYDRVSKIVIGAKR